MNAEASSPITTYFRVCDGARVRFADNRASSDTTVLLLAPWPETVWAFRRIWPRLAAVGRVVAIELPGFGHSDGRPEQIAPDAAGAFLARLIREWGLVLLTSSARTSVLQLRSSSRHDAGARHQLDRRRRRCPVPDRRGRCAQGDHRRRQVTSAGMDARTNIGNAVEAGASANSEPDVHEDYVSAYDLGRFAESARFVRQYPEQNPVLGDLLPTITTPTLILAGRNDEIVPWSNNEFLADVLPNSEILFSTPVTTRGSKRLGSTAGWSSIGSAAGTGAYRADIRPTPTCSRPLEQRITRVVSLASDLRSSC